MRIVTNGQTLSQTAYAVALAPIKAADLKPRTKKDADGNVGDKKLSPNGRETFSMSGVKVMAFGGADNTIREERNVYVSVLEPTDIQPLQRYDFAGTVWIDHYAMRDGSQTVTIIAEKLVPHVEKQNN